MKKLLSIALIIFLSVECFAPPIWETHFKAQISYLDADLHYRMTNILISQIWVESRGNSLVFNKTEMAAGILQIRPVMLRHVNYLLKLQGKELRYTLSDRFDSTKSVEMWRIVMEKHNPEYDVKRACIIWNGKGKSGTGSEKYYQRVKNRIKIIQ